MTAMTLWFGVNGQEGVWYIANGATGQGFTPINISLLPGPQPDFTYSSSMATTKVVGTVFNDQLMFSSRVLADTVGEVTVIDALQTWNVVKNMQVKSVGAQNLYVDGIVHVDAQIGLNDTVGSNLFLNGVKRANVLTGLGDDVIEIRMVSDQQSVWVDDFRINTGAGKDFVRLDGLDIAGELAAGDLTYIYAINKPNLPLISSGEGRFAHIATGANDDTIIGYTSNDHFIAGSDDGTFEEVLEREAASGFAYSIGGATSGGHNSTLYKINLATGATTAVGVVNLTVAPGKSGSNLDVESLSLNPKDGFLYGFVTTTGNVAGLVKVNPETAESVFIGGNVSAYKSTLQDTAFDLDGTLYIVSEGDLLKVSTTTGNTTMVGDNILSKKVGALAIDPLSGKMYALEEAGAKTIVTEINKTNGTVLGSWQVTGLGVNSKIEGMAFDSDGTLWAVDRVSGAIVTIDVVTHAATAVSTSLAVSKQTGDGFEALAIDGRADMILVDLLAKGGDSITTGGGFDHLFYAAGDGVDVVTDFDLAKDTLHITGYAAANIEIQSFNGDTFIRFKDGSADGYVDHAMIELSGVTGFDISDVSFISASDYYGV